MLHNLFTRAAVAVALLVAVTLPPTRAHAVANWRTVVVNYSAFDAEDTTDTVVLYTTKNNEVIHQVVMIRDTDFSGGSISSYTVAVGKSGATDKYQTATDVFTGVSNGYTNAISTVGPGVEVAGVAIIATAVASHNCSTATAGKLIFKILVSNL